AVNPWGRDTEGPEKVTAHDLTDAEKNAAPTISQLLPMDKLTSFNGILLTQAVRHPKAIHLPSTAAEAFIQFKNPLANGVCTDPAVIEDYK
ncbi:hypothetical protein, partial [Pseudomonas sp. FW305-25]